MRKGFTLIELLVVVAIISLLAGMSYFGVQSARQRAEDDKRLADLKAIQSALARYYADCFSYPLALPNPGDSLMGDPSLAPSCYSSNVYLQSFPGDPDPERNYYYQITEMVGGQAVSYRICAALSNDDDPDSDVAGCGSCGALACNIKFTN